MIKVCSACEAEFETKGRRLTCSVHCGRERHLEIRRRITKRYAARHPEVVRDRYLAYKRSHVTEQRAYQKARRASCEGYVDRFIERIALRTPDTDIDRAFLLELMASGKCQVTGAPFVYEHDRMTYHNPRAPSIDRIDSGRGYYRDNVQIVLSWLNRAKGEFSMEEFRTLLIEAAEALTQ